MPRCPCASEVYGSVCVCVCVCARARAVPCRAGGRVGVDCYSCSRMNQVQVRVSIGF